MFLIKKQNYYYNDEFDNMVLSTKNNIDYLIKDNKIIINGTKIHHGPSIINQKEDDWHLIEILKCNKEDCENASDYCVDSNLLNEYVYGEYEIEYLGNHNFSEIKNISKTKLMDSDIIDGYNVCE